VQAASKALWLLRVASKRTPICGEIAAIKIPEVQEQFRHCDNNYGDVPFENQELEDIYTTLKEKIGGLCEN
jgi:hypothetical protein